MGVVFRATQLALQRPVALKAIAPELAADTGFRERFRRESHLAASIDHPNVIPVYEAGELDETLYLIMRWVEGTDLRTLLTTSGRVSPGRAIKLLRPVASALAAAHRRGLVHRDVKPANILVARGDEEDDDHVYLTDFGIARRTDGGPATRTGVFVGTVDYTAPERFEGGKGDAACARKIVSGLRASSRPHWKRRCRPSNPTSGSPLRRNHGATRQTPCRPLS